MQQRAKLVGCPVCLNEAGGECFASATGPDVIAYACDSCQRFAITGSAEQEYFGDSYPWTWMQRWALSHRLATSNSGGKGVMLDTYFLERLVPALQTPTPPQQMINLLRLIGDHETSTGEPFLMIDHVVLAKVGCAGLRQWTLLKKEMQEAGLYTRIPDQTFTMHGIQQLATGAMLTFKGWSEYERERRGKLAGKYGFMAMKFNAAELEELVQGVIRPAIKEGIGYDVIDLRDVARAGVIDNHLREQIRDAAFILADLTHENAGAYWESGYAEGLGKPVIYICEQAKFDRAKTHFDTNHCTTVPWDLSHPEKFATNLVATVRRSLNLFAPP